MFPCCRIRNLEKVRAIRPNVGSTAPSSTVSGTSLWKSVLCGNVRADQPGQGGTRGTAPWESVFCGNKGNFPGLRVEGRKAQSNKSTSICANEEEVYCIRGVGAA